MTHHWRTPMSGAFRFLAILSLLGPASVASQSVEEGGAGGTAPPGVSTIFPELEGEWIGSGTLMQRDARFRMTWTTLDGGFVRLSFQNAWVGEGDEEIPVLAAEAVYLDRAGSIMGVWIDGRPQRIRLDAVVTDSSLVTTWTADAERGRTEYVIRSADEIVVLDHVEVDGDLRPFGEANYRRAGSSR